MLADYFIPRLSNGIKIAVQKNHLSGQIVYRSPNPVKKRRQNFEISQNFENILELKMHTIFAPFLL